MWVITKDLLFEEFGDRSHVGTASRDYDGRKLPYAFRIKDGDGEIYYHGRSDSCDDNKAFAPVDDFAAPNDGAPNIEYFNKKTKKWEEL